MQGKITDAQREKHIRDMAKWEEKHPFAAQMMADDIIEHSHPLLWLRKVEKIEASIREVKHGK